MTNFDPSLYGPSTHPDIVPQEPIQNVENPVHGYEDRRRDERTDCILPVLALIDFGNESVWTNRAMILNYSDGGFLLEAENSFFPDQHFLKDATVEVTFSYNPTSRKVYQARGTIVHAHYDGKTRVGIRCEKPFPKILS